jgi:hypothetical protein
MSIIIYFPLVLSIIPIKKMSVNLESYLAEDEIILIGDCNMPLPHVDEFPGFVFLN